MQRLANDSNPAVAAAASKAINELKKQWELEEGDSLTFKMNQCLQVEDRDESDWDNNNIGGQYWHVIEWRGLKFCSP